MSVTTHSNRCLHPNFFAEQSYCRYIPPPWKSASGLVLCSGDDAVDCDRYCSNTAPLSPWRPTRQNSSRIIILRRHADSARRWDTCGIWRPPCCGHHWPGCHPCRNRLVTEAYPESIFPDGKIIGSGMQLRKRGRLHGAIAASPRAGATVPRRRWQDLPKCTDRSSGCGSPVDYYILRFLYNLFSQIIATATSDLLFPS